MASLSYAEEGSCIYLDLPFFTHQKTTAKTTISSKAAEQPIIIINVFDNELSEGVYGGVSPAKKMSSPRVWGVLLITGIP